MKKLFLLAIVVILLAGTMPASACTEGCTPGYWKNHPESWPVPTNTTVVAVFAGATHFPELADDTLMDALGYGGGPGAEGGAKILLRAAVAAYLNHMSPVAYPSSSIVERTNERLAGKNREEMIKLAEEFDAWNNLGCPF